MHLYVILDCDLDNWQKTKNPKEITNNLLIFLNAFQKLDYQNTINIICNKKIIFTTEKHNLDSERIFTKRQSFISQDFGYTLCLARNKKCRILIFSMKEENKNEYLNLLKCSFSAQKLKIRVDGVCIGGECPTISQLCYSTGGGYTEDEDTLMQYLFSLLGNHKTNVPYYDINCICHGKTVEYGLVCPICLGVYCGFVPICRKCKTKISFNKNN